MFSGLAAEGVERVSVNEVPVNGIHRLKLRSPRRDW